MASAVEHSKIKTQLRTSNARSDLNSSRSKFYFFILEDVYIAQI